MWMPEKEPASPTPSEMMDNVEVIERAGNYYFKLDGVYWAMAVPSEGVTPEEALAEAAKTRLINGGWF